jgi:uncharacterized protein YggU (UPF0235/DUF167 family)
MKVSVKIKPNARESRVDALEDDKLIVNPTFTIRPFFWQK